jgi:hypothetical protein
MSEQDTALAAWEKLAKRLGQLKVMRARSFVVIPKIIHGRPARYVCLVGEGPTPSEAVINLMSQI